MRFDCCRSAGSAPTHILADSRFGTIPGAVHGSIPEEFAASQPIYFEGPVSLDEFLKAGNQSENDLDMRPVSSSQNTFMWPVTSRFSFVSAVSFALLAALLMCCQAQAADENSSSKIVSQNVQIAHKSQNPQDNEPSGRTISFVCGRPNTLQALAPMDLPAAKQVRYLPQGASPIAEMKFMPAPKAIASKLPSNIGGNTGGQSKLDKASTDRIFNRLLKLSLADPAVYQTEAPSLITYYSILTGGQDQKRVEELEKLLERNLNR